MTLHGRIRQRAGIDLRRASSARWTVPLAELITPLIERLSARLLAYDIMLMDETSIQVTKAAGRDPSSPSYLWMQCGGPREQPVVLFQHEPPRGQDAAAPLLKGYHGYLNADGFEV